MSFTSYDPAEPIHVLIQGSADDPRSPRELPPGVVAHYSPPLHPDDLGVIDGIPVTSAARTIVDIAEDMDRDELEVMIVDAVLRDIVELDEIEASSRRAGWRPSQKLLLEVLAEIRG